MNVQLIKQPQRRSHWKRHLKWYASRGLEKSLIFHLVQLVERWQSFLKLTSFKVPYPSSKIRQNNIKGQKVVLRLVPRWNVELGSSRCGRVKVMYQKLYQDVDYDPDDGTLLSHPNFKTLTTLGSRAFVASAPKLWKLEWPNLLTL